MLVGVARGAAPTLGEGLGVAVRATGGDLGAAADGVPGGDLATVGDGREPSPCTEVPSLSLGSRGRRLSTFALDALEAGLRTMRSGVMQFEPPVRPSSVGPRFGTSFRNHRRDHLGLEVPSGRHREPTEQRPQLVEDLLRGQPR